jgi:2-O-methyltransferase
MAWRRDPLRDANHQTTFPDARSRRLLGGPIVLLKRLHAQTLRRMGIRPGEVPKSYFRSLLPLDPVVVEAGAHAGTDTVGLARAWPGGHVHAFEPVPSLFTRLVDRTSSMKNVSCYQLALGGAVTTSDMHVSGGESDGSSSLLSPSGHLEEHPLVTFDARIAVSVTTLNAWAVAAGVPRVDFLWLDLQGSELDVLKAGDVLLRTVSVVYAEVSLKPMYDSAPLYPEVRSWMEGAGFAVVREELPWPDMGSSRLRRSGYWSSMPTSW